MLGINADWKDVNPEWKAMIITTGIIASFWYLCFFLFNRTLLVELPFYVPLIITIPLSCATLFSMIVQLFSLKIILKSETTDLNSSKFMYETLIYTVVYFTLIIIRNKVSYNDSLEEFSKLFALTNIVLTVVVLIIAIILGNIYRIRKERKSKKTSE